MIKELIRKIDTKVGDLNMEITEDTTEDKAYRNLKIGSRDNFKDNQTPMVVANNLPERQHQF